MIQHFCKFLHLKKRGEKEGVFQNWKLEGWLAKRGKTRYQLAEVMDGGAPTNQTTLYRLESAERINHRTLSRVIQACEKLTGERPGAGDLLEYRED